MDTSPSPNIMIGGQRSNNTTPYHHYYSTPCSTEQPSSFLSTHSYRPSPNLNDASHHLPQHHGGRPPTYGQSPHAGGSKTSTPLHHLPPNAWATPKSRGQSPSVNSLEVENNIMMSTNHHHHLSHLNHHPHPHHDHLHDNIRINCDNSSHSISPPNSNSNTTISCGSGNSTSANIGIPTHGSRNRGDDHHLLQNGRSNLNSSNRLGRAGNNNNKEKEDYNNYRNRSESYGRSSKRGKSQEKKSILEDDISISKNEVGSDVQNKFKHNKAPFINPNQEFLPICDALFNMISLAAYFCDCVFAIVSVYSWYKYSVETEEDKIFELSSIQQQQRNRLAGVIGSSSEIDDLQSSIPKEQMWQWSVIGLFFIFLSCTLSQILSFKWYKESERRGQRAPDGTDLAGPPPPCSSSILVLMHVSLLGVLWRYFKLFIPVDLRFVKNEVRDLCLLRLIHAFCQAAPMLLLQLYIIFHEPSPETVKDITKVSTALSLFSVCWALASFSKHIRKQNVHKLVLTWLGVIFQFFWRLGTVTSRFLALALYSTVYQYWVFVVLFLHWFCMLLWLISPKNIFHGEKMSPLRKVSYSAIVAVVYTFCYINVQETNSRVKVIIYYVTMFMENSLLLGVWLIAVRYEDEIWFRSTVTYLVFLCFVGGLGFMVLYYKYFHVKKLSYVYDAESSIYRNTSSIGGCSLMNDNGSMVATISGGDYETTSVSRGKTNGIIMAYSGGRPNNNSLRVNSNKKKSPPSSNLKKKLENKNELSARKKTENNGCGGGNENGGNSNARIGNGLHVHHGSNLPGVFNCRFHPAMKRKKKKPTTFVPPPTVRSQPANNNNCNDPPPPDHEQQSSSSPPTNKTMETEKEQIQGQAQSYSLSPLQNNFVDNPNHRILQNEARQSPHMNVQMPYPHDNEVAGSHSHQHRHNHHPSPSSPPKPHYHPMIVEYDSPNCSSGIIGGGSSSLNAHYDLPEYNAESNGSQSSSYGPVISGLYHHPHVMVMGKSASSSSTGRMVMAPAPFWRRPLSLTMGSENEGSVSSRVDIQQKLQEKKQQQLAELREIEEEIKQGKLKRPELHEICSEPVNQRQPIPVEKKQPWFGETGEEQILPSSEDQPEILLNPHQFLMHNHEETCEDNGNAFYYNPDWPPGSGNFYEPVYQNDADCGNRDDDEGDINTSPPSGGVSGCDLPKSRFGDRRRRQNKGYFDPSSRESIYKSYRIPSDIDSQMSLPRSYTLPREFKYKRKFRKPVKTENFLPSTNSSDGDVDSGEDPEMYSEVDPYPVPLPSMCHIHNETNRTPSLHQQQSSSPSRGVIVSMTPPTGGEGAAAHSGFVQATTSATTRQSRKILNGRPRHKLHETKL